MWTIIAIMGGYVITLPVWFIGMTIVRNSSGNGAGIYISIMLLTWVLSGRWIYARPAAHLKKSRSEADNINSEVVGIGLELKRYREERSNIEHLYKTFQNKQLEMHSRLSAYQEERKHYLQIIEECNKK